MSRRLDFKVDYPGKCWAPFHQDATTIHRPCPFHERGECQLVSTLEVMKDIAPEDVTDNLEDISSTCPLAKDPLESWADDLTDLVKEDVSVEEAY